MTTIPDDIMKPIPKDIFRVAADIVLDAQKGGVDPDHGMFIAIARAIMAERERCAKVAREYPFTEIFLDHKNHAVASNASQNIADMIEGKFASAIRKGEVE